MVLVKRNRINTIEERISHAEKQWIRVFDDIKNGIIDRKIIANAMETLNCVHDQAIKENKRYLIG